MPRKPLIRTAAYPYHITNRSNNKELFYLELEELWLVFMSVLSGLKSQFRCEVHAFVMMSNHYHLLISTPQENIGEAMKYFHREVARHANRSANRINHFFGGRYKWSLVSNELYYWNCLKYIFRNPVRAGITSDVEKYSFSSLVRHEDFEWHMVDPFSQRKNKIDLSLEWLNAEFDRNVEDAIRGGLRKREFEISQDKDRNKVTLLPASIKPRILPEKGTVT